jgi:glycine cleavage system H protein
VQFPEDVKYTEEHEWVRGDGETVRVGITDYAQDQLGDIVFVELPEVGSSVERGAVMVEIESTKSVGEVYAPYSGAIAAVNDTVRDRPELINQDPYGEGWLVEMTITDPEGPTLLDAAAYQASVE